MWIVRLALRRPYTFTVMALAIIILGLVAMQRMAKDMKRMSGMMLRMSGAADHPTMKEPEMRRQFEEMRAEMARMKQSHEMHKSAGSK